MLCILGNERIFIGSGNRQSLGAYNQFSKEYYLFYQYRSKCTKHDFPGVVFLKCITSQMQSRQIKRKAQEEFEIQTLLSKHVDGVLFGRFIWKEEKPRSIIKD